MLQDGSSWRQPMCRRPALPDDISEGPITKNLLLDAQHMEKKGLRRRRPRPLQSRLV